MRNCKHQFCLSKAWEILNGGFGCFYDWNVWKKTSRDVRCASGFRCEADHCNFHEDSAFEDPLLFLQVHHVWTLDEIAAGEEGDQELALDKSNLRALCLPHHNLIHRRPKFWHPTIKSDDVEAAFAAHAAKQGKIIHEQIPLVLSGDELLQIPHRGLHKKHGAP